MQKGSLVQLTKAMTDMDLEVLMERGVSIDRETIYTVETGPCREFWKMRTSHGVVKGWADAIYLEEIPGIGFNAIFFSEVCPPGEIAIEDVLPESQMEEVFA